LIFISDSSVLMMITNIRAPAIYGQMTVDLQLFTQFQASHTD
jgi:hypothetical protein